MGKEETHEMGKLRPVYQHYKQQKCFIGHTYNASWNKVIVEVCNEVLPTFNLCPWYADTHFDPTTSLREKVVEMIANTRYGIYDLSYWRCNEQSDWEMPRNVLIELGMAIALNRPILLLRHAANRIAGLALPNCLQSMEATFCEFTGGKKSLKEALNTYLPQWIQRSPEQEWRNRYCHFGGLVCDYRGSHPQAPLVIQKTIACHIADGHDIDQDDFRDSVEAIMERFETISYQYLDACSRRPNYNFLLCSHCQLVRSTPFAIYRLTSRTPAETFIAIGISIALEAQFGYKIPKILLTEKLDYVPSLLTGYEVVVARNDQELRARLIQFLPQVIQRVQETAWKPQALPFVEFSTRLFDIPPPSEEKQAFSDPSEEENMIFEGDDGDIEIIDLQEAIDDTNVNNMSELALKQIEEDTQLHPNDAQVYNDKGEVAAMLKRYDEALDAYNRAIEIEPDNPSFYYNRGRVYLAQKKYKQAFEDFEMTVALNPEYPDARRQRDMIWNMLSSSLDMPFHQRLKRERELRGLSQSELAEKIGADLKTLYRWEAGRSLPQPLYRIRLSEFFGKSLVELGLIKSNSDQDYKDIQSQESSENAQKHPRSNLPLIQAREERGWTQEDLAEKLDVTSINISRWERGVTLPNPYFRQRLCQVFNKTEEELGLQYHSDKE